MPLVMGLNHRTAAVSLRERFAISLAEIPAALTALKTAVPIEEAVLLSTCNRFEIYLRAQDAHAAQSAVRSHWEARQGGPLRSDQFYCLESEDAVRHLFRVASGLDSMVPGEHEILGQVKQAYQTAQQNGFTGKLLNVLFQRSLFVGKRVRTETGLALGSASVASVAVTLAERIFGSLAGRRVLVLGAGAMAELAVKHLQSQKVLSVSVANRTFEHAVELARSCGGSALTWDEGLRQLAVADIVIGSVSVPEPVLRVEHLKTALAERRGRSLFLIDIAMPRCMDPSINSLDNLYLFNLDDLQKIVAENSARRALEIAKAESMIDVQTHEFTHWLSAHRAGLNLGLKHA
jgi:glutamyl-tRNA reductase